MNKYRFLKRNVWCKRKGSFFKHQLWNYYLKNENEAPFGKKVKTFNEEGC